MNTMKIIDSDSLRKYKRQTNFFETPAELADKMAWFIDSVGHDARILEPSAGMGALINAVHRAIKYPIQPIEFCEIQDQFVPHLESIGARRVGSDFEQYHPGPVYNAVIMNPPYRNGLAEKHVDHAWSCIKPGGSIVALVSKSSVDWIYEEFTGYISEHETIPRNTFRETAIETHLFAIHKPLCS